jgi:hypothetical protein
MKIKLFIVLFFTCTIIFAQQAKQLRVKALKVSYITNAIDLTSSEAEQFWPVYNKYNTKLKQLKFDSERGIVREINLAGGFDNINEEEAGNILNKAKKLEQEVAETKIQMINELSTVISAKKILRLLKAEKEFNRKLLNEYGKRKRMQGQ